VGDGGLGSGGQPFVERAAFVGFDVAEGDPAQPPQVEEARHGLETGGKQRALAAVEEQRLPRVDQELVEGETTRTYRGQEGGETVDAFGDLVDFGLHGYLRPDYSQDRPGMVEGDHGAFTMVTRGAWSWEPRTAEH
jgi:hypothetical protein